MFNPTTPAPTVTERDIRSTRDGYSAETFCLLDGYPARVSLHVDTENVRCSNFDIEVFNPVEMRWDSVYSLNYAAVGHLGPLPDLAQLNDIAMRLWTVAELVLTIAHRRLDEADTDLAVMRETAIQAREARMRETAQGSAKACCCNGTTDLGLPLADAETAAAVQEGIA
jgi:hypothetical protein